MTAEFAARIRERYPEGLTGIFAIGRTRTAYILEQNQQAADPGKIADFGNYAAYLETRYQEFIKAYLDLGGRTRLLPCFRISAFLSKEVVAENTAALAQAEYERTMQLSSHSGTPLGLTRRVDR